MKLKFSVSKEVKIILFLIFGIFLLSLFFIYKYYFLNPSYLSGDEPHYVMMADSLVKDGDFNLKNDYELGRSTSYYPVPGLFPHISPAVDLKSSEWYSIHNIGLPIIIAPAYKLFGLMGVRVWVIILQLALIPLFYLILKRHIKDKGKAILGVSLLAVCPLFWQNLGSLFPDLLIVSLTAALLVLFPRQDKLSNALFLLLAILIGLIHTKGLILVAPIVLLNTLWLIKKTGFIGWAKKHNLSIAIAVVSLVLYAHFLQRHYGTVSPSGLYGNNGQLFSANPVYNGVAMLIDRNKGLLVYFPILGLLGPYIIFGLLELSKLIKRYIKKPKEMTVNHYVLAGVLLGLAVLFVSVISFNDWSGSTGPNGRSVLPFIVFAIFIIARYTDLRNRLQILTLGIGGILCLWLSWLSISDFRYYMSPGANSFWVDRFEPLARLPMFNLTATELGRGPLVRGIKILLVILAVNIIFYVICRYRITLKKRKLSF